MARGRKPRHWVKIDCNGILRGSVNWILTLEEQAVWVKLIAYSEVCGGPPGYIQDNEGGGLPRDYLSMELHCPLEVLNSTITKMTKDKAVNSNGTGVIQLVNFETYQFSEYDRQKPYREAKKEKERDPDKYTKGQYGDLVVTSKEGVDEILKERRNRK